MYLKRHLRGRKPLWWGPYWVIGNHDWVVYWLRTWGKGNCEREFSSYNRKIKTFADKGENAIHGSLKGDNKTIDEDHK